MRLISAIMAAGACVVLSGCEIRKAMYDQPKYQALQQSDFFGDERSARPLIEGTVARDHLRADRHFYEGVVDGKPAEVFPFEMTKADLERGRERYNIHCSPCHDQSGSGNGMIVKRGFKQPPSYHSDRLRASPPGYFFDVTTRGFGQMNGYAGQIKPDDRWRIAAYIRVLQLSQHATSDDVPADIRAQLTTGSQP